MNKIPLLKPDIPHPMIWSGEFTQSWIDKSFSNFGPSYNKAMQSLNKRTGCKSLLVSNGTVAIQIALQANLLRGSRVAIPHFTFMATFNAVVAAGMQPVLVESSIYDWTIDKTLLEELQDLYDAFIVVSPMGHWVNVNAYDELAKRLGKEVIYDFAAASFQEYSKTYITTLSFHATKNLPIGEGGAVLFNSDKLLNKAKELINFDFDEHKWPQSMFGMNGKMDELHAALLNYQLNQGYSKVLENANARQTCTKEYEKLLIEYFAVHPYLDKAVVQLSVLRPYKDEIMIKARQALEDNNISYRTYYDPTLFDVYLNNENTSPLTACLALPCYKDAPIEMICDIIKAAL